MKKETIVPLILSALISGCASTLTKVEPTNSADTLIVGRAEFNCSDSPRNKLSVGSYQAGLILQFQNIETEENFTLYTEGKDGFFFINNPSIETLKLKKVTVKDPFTGWSAFLAPNDQNIYNIKRGKVNNLGLLVCHVDLIESEYDQTFNAGYDGTVKQFLKRYPDSQWNNHEWINIIGEK